jgi:hypothetical protein
MKSDPKFSKIVYDIMDEEVIRKFENKTGKAEDFYDLEESGSTINGKCCIVRYGWHHHTSTSTN